MDQEELMRSMLHFMKNYTLVFSYSQNAGGTQWISDNNDQVCRFCGKSDPLVTFSKKAHAISELIGNKEFLSKNECDICNEHFGNFLEDEFSKYVGLHRTIGKVTGKNGVPSYKSYDGKCRVDFTNKGLVIQDSLGSDFVEKKEKYMIIHAVRQSYTPIAVYKALVKMALSLLPIEYMFFFHETNSWLLEKSHTESEYNMVNYLWMIERIISGSLPLDLRVKGFIRNSDLLKVPYYIFVIEFSNLFFQITVPCNVKDSHLKGQSTDIVVCPSDHDLIFNPYGKINTKIKIMSNPEKVKNDPLKVTLGFEKSERHSGNGMTIDDLDSELGIVRKKKRCKK